VVRPALPGREDGSGRGHAHHHLLPAHFPVPHQPAADEADAG
jgi:hypothetical protein